MQLRWSEVRGDTLVLGDSKTAPRKVPLNTHARSILDRQPRVGSPFVFPSPFDPARPRSPDLQLWYRVRLVPATGSRRRSRPGTRPSRGVAPRLLSPVATGEVMLQRRCGVGEAGDDRGMRHRSVPSQGQPGGPNRSRRRRPWAGLVMRPDPSVRVRPVDFRRRHDAFAATASGELRLDIWSGASVTFRRRIGTADRRVVAVGHASDPV